MGFATKAATDFGGGDTQLVGIKAQQSGALVAINKVALGAHPHFGSTIRRHRSEAGMRLDIALMYGPRGEGTLDDDFGCFKTLVDVALLDMPKRSPPPSKALPTAR